jgi:hypothetical protein
VIGDECRGIVRGGGEVDDPAGTGGDSDCGTDRRPA